MESGARNVENIVNSAVLLALATHIIVCLVQQKLSKHICLDVQDDDIFINLIPLKNQSYRRSIIYKNF